MFKLFPNFASDIFFTSSMLSIPLNLILSSFVASVIESVPSPKLNTKVSEPAPPVNLSFPFPPVIVSSPASPFITSL